MRKRILVVVLVLAAFVAGTQVGAADIPIKLVVNGKPVEMDVEPMLVNGRVLVPARFVAEGLGAVVGWDGTTRTVKVWGGYREDRPTAEGPPEFQNKIAAGLRLLRDKAPDKYEMVNRNLKLIIMAGEGTGVGVHSSMGVYIEDPKILQASDWFVAGVLAHEAAHVEFWRQDPETEEARSAEERERAALDVEIDTLFQIGAPAELIERARQAIDTRWWEAP